MLADGLKDIPGYEVSSAGSVAEDGAPMPPQAKALARHYRLNPDSHKARYLTEQVVAESDLLIAMSRSHRSQIVRYAPSKISKTFTLREFARLSARLSDEQVLVASSGETLAGRVDGMVRAVFAQKASGMQLVDPILDDVIDPYRRADSVFAQSGDEIEPAIREAIRVLRIAAQEGK
jgi:protein-tyrosine phosphatase